MWITPAGRCLANLANSARLLNLHEFDTSRATRATYIQFSTLDVPAISNCGVPGHETETW
jgi:hypothetical protein